MESCHWQIVAILLFNTQFGNALDSLWFSFLEEVEKD